MSFKSLKFNGHFRVQHRRRLLEYRMLYGLTYRDMACIFGCEWSTVMKWEKGECRECKADKLVVLQSFFNNDENGIMYQTIESCYALIVERFREIVQMREAAQREAEQLRNTKRNCDRSALFACERIRRTGRNSRREHQR